MNKLIYKCVCNKRLEIIFCGLIGFDTGLHITKSIKLIRYQYNCSCGAETVLIDIKGNI